MGHTAHLSTLARKKAQISSVLIVYCLPSLSRIFHSYGVATACWWSAANFVLYSALRAIEEGGIFFVLAPTATRDLSLWGLIRRTSLHVPQWDSNTQRKEQLLT